MCNNKDQIIDYVSLKSAKILKITHHQPDKKEKIVRPIERTINIQGSNRANNEQDPSPNGLVRRTEAFLI